MRRNKKLNISISKSLLDSLSKEAQSKGFPLSSYIRSLILESIKTNSISQKEPKKRISIALSQEEYQKLAKFKNINWEESLRRYVHNRQN